MIDTDSPQPQAEVWFGLLKTKPDFSIDCLVVHLGAEQEQHRLGIDEDLDALVLDDLIERLLLLRPFHRVFHAGAAAILDAEAQGRPPGSPPWP